MTDDLDRWRRVRRYVRGLTIEAIMAQLPGASVAKRLEATYRSEVTRELEDEVAILRTRAIESVRTTDRLVSIIERQQARIVELEAENARLRTRTGED